MKKSLLFLTLCALLVSSASAATLYKITFDNSTSGTFSSGSYTPGSDELLTGVTGSGSGLGVLPYGSNTPVPNWPMFRSASAVSASNAAIQGGMVAGIQNYSMMSALPVSGIVVDFQDAIVGPISLTMEAALLPHTLNVPGNTAGISNIISTEWPDNAGLDYNLRIVGDKLQFVVARSVPAPEVVAEYSTALVVDRWYHAAGVLKYNSTTPASSSIELWVDSVLRASATIDLSAGTYANFFYNAISAEGAYGNAFTIGHNAGAVHFNDKRGLDGYVDAVVISDEALNDTNFVITHPNAAVADWAIYN